MSEWKDAAFFDRWFQDFGRGIARLDRDARGLLFQACAAACAKDALKDLYHDLFQACEGNLDRFFSRLHEIGNVGGRVVEAGKRYELAFLRCGCPLHTEAKVNTPALCECSRQSIIAELREWMPNAEFIVEEKGTILRGDPKCCFSITRIESR